MPLTVRLLASGPGWRVEDVLCDHGPDDRPFQEQHDSACLAIVSQGTFYHRSPHGEALLVPGAVLLGNPGACFECAHDHSRGDRCLSFHLAPEFMDEIAEQIRGIRAASFSISQVPPLRSLMPLVAAAEIARDRGQTARLEELGVSLAAEVLSVQTNSRRVRTPTARDVRRVWASADWMEAHEESLSLSQLARMASMSRYHFLRTFRAVTGTTPYQYLLALRLRHAFVELERSPAPIAGVAYKAGFRDLSTFNRRFRRLTGMTPREYRQSVWRESRRRG
jgi:AraC family transcriptional regulator